MLSTTTPTTLFFSPLGRGRLGLQTPAKAMTTASRAARMPELRAWRSSSPIYPPQESTESSSHTWPSQTAARPWSTLSRPRREAQQSQSINRRTGTTSICWEHFPSPTQAARRLLFRREERSQTDSSAQMPSDSIFIRLCLLNVAQTPAGVDLVETKIIDAALDVAATLDLNRLRTPVLASRSRPRVLLRVHPRVPPQVHRLARVQVNLRLSLRA